MLNEFANFLCVNMGKSKTHNEILALRIDDPKNSFVSDKMMSNLFCLLNLRMNNFTVSVFRPLLNQSNPNLQNHIRAFTL